RRRRRPRSCSFCKSAAVCARRAKMRWEPPAEQVSGAAVRAKAPDNLRACMPEARYDPQAIEGRWQEVWSAERTWEVSNEDRAGDPRPPGSPAAHADAPGRTAYVLEMLPYPSGEPHIGHLKCYALGDAI